MNEKFEKYIEGLSPEMQEKARECKTVEELNEFIADNDLEIPEDALEAVAGGCTSGGCEHSFYETGRIGMLPYLGSNDKHIMYNGKTVHDLITKVCSKCGETRYLIVPVVSGMVGKIECIVISQSEYNTLKAQKTW